MNEIHKTQFDHARFHLPTPRNMIMRVLTICEKLTQLIALKQMRLDRRLLSDCHCRVIEIEKLTFRFGLSRPRGEGARNKT